MKDKPCAVYSISSNFGIEIMGVETGLDESVEWRWMKEKKVHKSKVKEVDGELKFRVNRNWISLDECVRL